MITDVWLVRQHQLFSRAIRQGTFPLPTKRLLLQVLTSSLEQAGQEQAEGRRTAGLGCAFDLTVWALQFKRERAALRLALQQAEEARLLQIEPDPQDAAAGTLLWTLPGGERLHRGDKTRPSPSASTYQFSLPSTAEPSTADQHPWLTRHWKGRPPRRVWAALRQQVLERDNWTCCYCGRRSGPLACDHVLPVSRGGRSTLDNLVTACQACNGAKATKTVEEWTRMRSRPRRKGGH